MRMGLPRRLAAGRVGALGALGASSNSSLGDPCTKSMYAGGLMEPSMMSGTMGSTSATGQVRSELRASRRQCQLLIQVKDNVLAQNIRGNVAWQCPFNAQLPREVCTAAWLTRSSTDFSGASPRHVCVSWEVLGSNRLPSQ